MLAATGLRTKTLLYVEDVGSNVELMKSLMTGRPRWRMVVAGRGELGQELATTAAPDLVLIDLDLPDMTGEDVLRHLRADPVTHALPVVVLSADANLLQIDRLMAAGASGYLTKPISVSDVLRLLEAHDLETAHPDSADVGSVTCPPVSAALPKE